MNEKKTELNEKQAAAAVGGDVGTPTWYAPSEMIWVDRCNNYAEVQDGVCKSKSAGPSCSGCKYNN